MTSSRRFFLIVAACSWLLHCATSDPYPEHWSPPAPVSVGECADISGVFSNACSSTDYSDAHCFDSGGLAGLLFARYAGSFHTELGSADRVVISQPSPTTLRVEAWKGAKLVHEEEIRLEPKDCKADGVLIRTGIKATQIEGGIGTGSSRALLRQTQDGDLLASSKVQFTGLWFILPVSGSSQRWLRFDRLEDE